MTRRLSLSEMLENHFSNYAVVVAAAKRGREILDGELPLLEVHAAKPVTIALEEIRQGKIHIELPAAGLK